MPGLRSAATGVSPLWQATAVVTADDVRRLALALPHVIEIDSEGFDFRVGGKGFVWSYPEREPGRPRRIRDGHRGALRRRRGREAGTAPW